MKDARTTRVLVTGGAGFIGSHLVETLISQGTAVTVFDNLSAGTLENVERPSVNTDFTFVRGDLLNQSDISKLEGNRYETIFHLAANPEVRVASTNPEIHYQQNVTATKNLLEFTRKTQQNTTLIFPSTSTVYGEPEKIPTPEDYTPLKPISIYGATKLACEALISGWAHTFGFKAAIFRLANIVGPRSRHGVLFDLHQKLKKNPRELEILGDGTQTKSYLYIDDCINAMLLGLRKARDRIETYNVGTQDQTDVRTIVRLLIDAMKLKNVKLNYTGGVDGGRGWKGDVKNMLLDSTRLRQLGWKPRFSSTQAIAKTARQLPHAHNRLARRER